MTRRGLLTGAAAVAGMTALPQLLRPYQGLNALAAGPAHAAIGHVVVDERLPQSAFFARGLAGQRLHRVNALDDLCHRWYTRLRAEVLADAGRIAGLTHWMDYEVMRSCAAEIGYVGVFHAEHRPPAATAPGSHGWAESLGSALATGARLRPGQSVHAMTADVADVADGGPMHMVTWVFAPRH